MKCMCKKYVKKRVNARIYRGIRNKNEEEKNEQKDKGMNSFFFFHLENDST